MFFDTAQVATPRRHRDPMLHTAETESNKVQPVTPATAKNVVLADGSYAKTETVGCAAQGTLVNSAQSTRTGAFPPAIRPHIILSPQLRKSTVFVTND
jgi:hypothetical protein